MKKTCITCHNWNNLPLPETCDVYKTQHSENDYCFRWIEVGSVDNKGIFEIDFGEYGTGKTGLVETTSVPIQDDMIPRTIDLAYNEERKIFLTPHPTWDIFDASKINEYLMCPRRFFYKYVLGWDSEVRSHDLEFGTAWHIAMEYLLLNGYGKEQILEAHRLFRNHYETFFPVEDQPDLEPKTSAMALLALVGYVEEYNPYDYFKVHYTEVSGSVNIIDNHILHFRIDTIAEDDRGIFSLEHKTTKTLERTFQDKWELDMQPNLYNHVLHCMFPDSKIYGVIINGTALHKQGPRTKKQPAEFLRVPVVRKPEMMNAWMLSAADWLVEMKRDYDRLSYCSDSDNTLNAFKCNTTSCTDFWGCRFHDFCAGWANPLQYCQDIPTGFVQRFWDPAHPEDHPKAKYVYNDGVMKEDLL